MKIVFVDAESGRWYISSWYSDYKCGFTPHIDRAEVVSDDEANFLIKEFRFPGELTKLKAIDSYRLF